VTATAEWCAGAAILKEPGDSVAPGKPTVSLHEACSNAGVSPFDEPPTL
jgi:hypothetical protein